MSPGPGAYSATDRLLGRRHKFPSAKRKLSYTDKETWYPGPGSYSPSARVGTPAFSFGSRISTACRSLSPGPTQYSIKETSSAPLWSFRKSERCLEGASLVSNPGPGTYNTITESCNSPAFTLKSRIPIPGPRLNTPGPGAYGGLYTQFT